MRCLLVSQPRHAAEAWRRCGLAGQPLIRHAPASRHGLPQVEQDLDRAIRSSGPFPWLIAAGPACALVQHVATQSLSVRAMGAVLLFPDDWLDAHIRVQLTETPFAFPVLTMGASAALNLAWRAVDLPADQTTGILQSPAFQTLHAARKAALQSSGALAAQP